MDSQQANCSSTASDGTSLEDKSGELSFASRPCARSTFASSQRPAKRAKSVNTAKSVRYEDEPCAGCADIQIKVEQLEKELADLRTLVQQTVVGQNVSRSGRKRKGDDENDDSAADSGDGDDDEEEEDEEEEEEEEEETDRVSPLTLAAWNVRSLLDNPRSNRPERRTALVARELARYKVDIAALSETSFSEQGQLEEVGAGYTYWSGRPKAEPRHAGVAFAIRNDIVR
nr:unnamed protein product [Spirometra erinaceieuropaei]